MPTGRCSWRTVGSSTTSTTRPPPRCSTTCIAWTSTRPGADAVLRIALKGVLARRLRLGLTAASIVIGVAFVSGTLVLTDTLNATFDQIFGNATKGVSVVVRGEQAFEGSGDNGPVDERALVPDAALDTVKAVPGVSDAVGDAGGYAQLVYKGTAVVNGGAPNLGTAWVGEGPLSSLHLVTGK